ncbi:MAG: hypothetical protein Q8T08_21005, partial [Ignavibacteria bacterium]|nr:hypothetical protein [Ignavibacteria bacterium]
MPDTIQFKDGHQIINLYDASGRKLSTRNYTILIRSEVPMVNSLQQGQVLDLNYNMDIIDETGTFYVDNIEYDFNGCDTGVYMLRNVYNTEGYANQLYSISGTKYQYYRKDHLGNNREIWCANTNTTLQRTQYYPSGLPWRTTTG